MVKTKIFEIEKNIVCSIPVKCSDDIIEKLKPLGLKLRADKETDTVNGYLSMNHIPNNHTLTIGIYEEDEKPNDEHLTTLKKPTKFPTQNQIEKLLK